MQPLLTVEIDQISITERMQLVEALWDSILASPESLPVTDVQKQLLDKRLEQHHRNPNEGSSWQAVKERLNDL
ncbi:MAG: addiction module protein [Phormidesmis sp.]